MVSLHLAREVLHLLILVPAVGDRAGLLLPCRGRCRLAVTIGLTLCSLGI